MTPAGVDEPAGSPLAAPDTAIATPPHRKTIVTIRRRRRDSVLSPAEVLARAADRGQPAMDPLGILQSMLERPAAEPVVRAPPAQAGGHRGGADADFWQIWLTHRNYLRARSLRFSSGNMADAEDALSEAMLKAAQTFESTAIHNHRAWLLRLVHNACMDRHRKNRRQTRLAKDITESDAPSLPALAVQPGRTPEELLAAFQQVGNLQRAMMSLPAFLVEPLLRHLDEESDAEIAGSLHVTKEVVRKRRQIARAMLRRQMPL